MTISDLQSTGPLDGSSRTTAPTDEPWWKVRGSLAFGLAASFAAAVAAYRLAGVVNPGWTLTRESLSSVLLTVSATPTLTAIGLIACVLGAQHKGRRAFKLLCAFLAFAALIGTGLNVAREAYGRDAIDTLIEKVIAEAPAQFAWRGQ